MLKVSIQYNEFNIIISDLNDCSIENGGCEQLCKMVPQGKMCDCFPGFSLNLDQTTCGGEIINR